MRPEDIEKFAGDNRQRPSTATVPQGYDTAEPYSPLRREADRLEERARMLRRYDELKKQYPDFLELIHLHNTISYQQDAKTTRLDHLPLR